MEVGQITETVDGNPVEIKELRENIAIVYQLDSELNRIKKFRSDEYLLGRITIKEHKSLDL